MSKTFRPYSIDQQILLPQDLRSWLPDDHLAVFVSDIVDELDLSAIFDAYEQGDGRGVRPQGFGDGDGDVNGNVNENGSWAPHKLPVADPHYEPFFAS